MQLNRILIIDDDRDFAESLALALSRLGLSLHTAYSSDEAVLAIRTSRFDCAICDYRLGKEDGISLLALMRAEATRMPVVMITAYGDVGSAVKAMQAGAADYLEKPFAPEDLFKVILTAITSSSKSNVIDNLARSSRSSLSCLTKREMEVARALVAGKSSKDIATGLGTSHRTIESHRRNILGKLSLNNTAALVRLVVLSDML